MFFEINNQTKIKVKEALVKKVLNKTEESVRRLRNKKISLAVVSSKVMRGLNRSYRGVDKVSCILSFVSEERNFISPKNEKNFLGEIILSPVVILKQAKENKKSFENEIALLIIHGLLHLAGFTHHNENQALKMNQMEQKIFKRLGKI